MGNFFRKLFGGNGDPPRPPPAPPREPERGPRSVKVVIVGAAAVGKTSMVINYNTSAFNEEHVPSVLDVYRGEREFDG